MEQNDFDIYEKIRKLEVEFIEIKSILRGLEEKWEEFEKLYMKDKKIGDDDTKAYWTIHEILKKYDISRQTFCDYRRLFRLEPAGRKGMFEKYKKTEVKAFFETVSKAGKKVKSSNDEMH